MGTHIEVSKLSNNKKYCLLITLLALLGVAFSFGLYLYQRQNVNNWNTYSNTDVGYEIKYPANWYVKEEGREDCRLTEFGEGITCIESLSIENREEKVVLVLAGSGENLIITKNGSYFRITVFEVSSPDISSTEEWIQSAYLPEDVKEERLAEMQVVEIGGDKMNVWKSSSGGIEFYYEGKAYQISYGSNKPFGLDSGILETMVNSLRID